MPNIPQHWIDADVVGMEEIALPGGLVYDPLNQCVTGDGIEWDQPDMLSLLRDSIRYRWLIADHDMGQGDVLHGLLYGRPVDGPTVDDEIDSAMTPNEKVSSAVGVGIGVTMNTKEHALTALARMLETVEQAIASGDWKVDGACDPDANIVYAKHVLQDAGWKQNSIDESWMQPV